jgi:CheY-like chemotaxis protein
MHGMINKALVINDDTISLMVACKMISKAEFAKETVTAHDGQEALSYIADCLLKSSNTTAGLPEFIFLDLHMPVMNGWDFLNIFSEKYADLLPNIKVAIISSYVSEEELVRLRQYGLVLDYIPAPMNLGKLTEVKEKFNRFRNAA